MKIHEKAKANNKINSEMMCLQFSISQKTPLASYNYQVL